MTSELWSTPAMAHLEETERLKMDRKLLKPQVERRRRERMNRSLESLRVLLLQSPETGSQRRVEKAEILEHTVLFLQTSLAQAEKNQSGEEASEGRRFMDGFSACLHKAAHFLQAEGDSRGLQGPSPSSLVQHLSRPHPPASRTGQSWTRISPRTSLTSFTSVPNKKSQNQHAIVSSQGLKKSERRSAHPYTHPARHIHTHTSPARSQDHTHQPASTQHTNVWRPWP